MGVMGVYGYLWVFMGIYESMDVYGYLRMSMNIYGGFYGYL